MTDHLRQAKMYVASAFETLTKDTPEGLRPRQGLTPEAIDFAAEALAHAENELALAAPRSSESAGREALTDEECEAVRLKVVDVLVRFALYERGSNAGAWEVIRAIARALSRFPAGTT